MVLFQVDFTEMCVGSGCTKPSYNHTNLSSVFVLIWCTNWYGCIVLRNSRCHSFSKIYPQLLSRQHSTCVVKTPTEQRGGVSTAHYHYQHLKALKRCAENRAVFDHVKLVFSYNTNDNF